MPVRQRLLVLAACLAWTGCGNDGPLTPVTGTVNVHVTALSDSIVLDGALVSLIDAETLRPIMQIVRLGPDGHATLLRVPSGDYLLSLYQKSVIVFAGANGRISVSAGRTTSVDRVLQASVPWFENGFAITGTVVDAETSAPIPGAFVVPWGFQGSDVLCFGANCIVPETAITDSAGRFTLVDASIAIDSRGTLLFYPVDVSAPGYRTTELVSTSEYTNPLWLGGALPPPPPGDTTLSVVVHMRRVQPGDSTGAIVGRVTCGGDPAGGVHIALSAWATAADTLPAQGVPVQGATAVSAPDGFFLFSGLAPGDYVLVPGYLPDDGFARSYSFDRGVHVMAAHTTDSGDVSVLRVTSPLDPPVGSHLCHEPGELRWRSVPGASAYYLALGSPVLLEPFAVTPDTSLSLANVELPVSAPVRWSVYAVAVSPGTTDSTTIGTFETPGTFIIAPCH